MIRAIRTPANSAYGGTHKLRCRARNLSKNRPRRGMLAAKGVGSRFRRLNDPQCQPALWRNRLPTPFGNARRKIMPVLGEAPMNLSKNRPRRGDARRERGRESISPAERPVVPTGVMAKSTPDPLLAMPAGRLCRFSERLLARRSQRIERSDGHIRRAAQRIAGQDGGDLLQAHPVDRREIVGHATIGAAVGPIRADGEQPSAGPLAAEHDPRIRSCSWPGPIRPP